MTSLNLDPKFARNRITSGDCRELIKLLPNGSVDVVVTSPPYWGEAEKSRFRRFGAIGSACFELVVALNFLRGRATRPSCCMSSSTRRRVHAMPAGL